MLPRFTLRQALVVLTVGAVVAFGLTRADADHTAAFGLAASLGSLVLAFAVYALFYGAVLLLSPSKAIRRAGNSPAAASRSQAGEGD